MRNNPVEGTWSAGAVDQMVLPMTSSSIGQALWVRAVCLDPKVAHSVWLVTALAMVVAAVALTTDSLGLDRDQLLTIAAVFIGSCAAGLAGFAFSAITGAMLFHFVAPMTAVPLLLACSITTQLVSIAGLWRSMRWRQCLTYLAGGVAGIPLGAMLLQRLDARVFSAGFGGFLVFYSVYMLLRPATVWHIRHKLLDAIAGFGGGVLGGAIAFPGALPTIWCTLQGLSKEHQRGTVQPFILLMQIATLSYYARFGMLAAGLTRSYAMCVPAVIGGTWIGMRLFGKISDRAFRRLVLIFLLASGAALFL
jgi:uncharacterized membrane protein YfcA